MTKEFTTLSSKVSENSDISYLATIKINGKNVKKRRYFDLFDSKTKTGIESKVGNPKLTDFTKTQIQKDIASLVKRHTKKIVWISNKNNKGDVGFDDKFIKYAKDLLKKTKGVSEDMFEFRGKKFKPPYLNTDNIYKGID